MCRVFILFLQITSSIPTLGVVDLVWPTLTPLDTSADVNSVCVCVCAE